VLALGLAAYAIAAHLGLAHGTPWPALLLLLGLIAAASLRAYGRGAWRQSLLLAAIATALAVLAFSGRADLALYLPPLAITLSILLLFAGTLQPARTPLVTRMAQLLEGDLPPEVVRYTRSVTVAWVLFLAAMNLELWLLALLAPPEIWSLFANFINYALLLLFFAGEYQLRRRCLPHRPQPGFLAFMRRLSTIRLSEAAKR
jgi:uncharacterized membrane protein